MLTAQVPTSGASKADRAVSQDQEAAKTNESAEIAQKLTNPLAAMICVLSTRKFAIGPTAVALKHKDHTNVGLLASHVWSVVGSDSHPDVSETYAQPFVAYTTTKAYAPPPMTPTTGTAGRWTAIVNPIRVSKLLKLGPQRLSVGGALRCTVTSPQYQPKGCGLEFTVTPVYPAKREWRSTSAHEACADVQSKWPDLRLAR
jgi:hypothetical protein